MYAIICDGDHQYRVEEGLTLRVQRPASFEAQATIEFDRVLAIGEIDEVPKIGRPTVEGAKVLASVLAEFRGEKIIVRKFKRRKGYARKQGHRQQYLQVRVDKIEH